MKSLSRTACLIALAPVAFTAAVAQDSQKQDGQKNEPVVVVQPATARPIARRSEFVGRIEAIEKVDVRVRVTGTLLKPHFKEGQTVKPGELLYEIDPAPFQAEVDAKKAQVASAKAQAQNSEVSFGRAQELLRTNAGTRATFDQRKAEMAQADASVQIAEAALESANITLGYTRITAPIAGRIGRTAITEGNIVSPQSGALTTIVKDSDVYALFSVSQREIIDYAKRKSGKPPIVRLKLADGSFYDKTSQISYMENTVDSKTDTQVVRATFDNPDRLLVDSQTVRVVVEEMADKPDVVVPQSVLMADQTGTTVMIVDGESKVVKRYVKLGATRDGVVAVLDGVKEGEKVIVQGAQRVQPGMKVNAKTQAEADQQSAPKGAAPGGDKKPDGKQ